MSRALLLSTSIILIIVSYPGGPFPLLVCFAVAPALIATAKLKPIQSAFALGLWAWIWWLAALWWAIPSLTAFSDSSGLISILLIALVCFTLALPYALSAFLIAYFKLWHSRFNLIQIPLCFAVLISLFASILPAAPVNALFEFPILLQWADIGGLPLLVFFYFVFNATLASIFIHKKKRYSTAIPTLILIPLLVLSYGYYKLSEPEQTTTTITLGYIQPLTSPEDTLSNLISQTRKLKEASEQLELIIWPEVPVDFSWHDTEYERYRIRQLAQELDSHLIILSGYHYANKKNADGGHYNSANFISSEGKNLAEYRKQRLVPFFEYLPLKAYLLPYFPNVRNYIAGKKAVPFEYNDRTIAPLICYEALFTDLVRAYVDEGADIIVNPGNDGWFGEAGALSHLSLALLRTIEYRMPMIRVNNSGVSTVINHKGEILFDTLSPLNAQTGKVFTLEIPKGKQTFYYKYGGLLSVLSIVLLLLSLMNRRKYLQNQS